MQVLDSWMTLDLSTILRSMLLLIRISAITKISSCSNFFFSLVILINVNDFVTLFWLCQCKRFRRNGFNQMLNSAQRLSFTIAWVSYCSFFPFQIRVLLGCVSHESLRWTCGPDLASAPPSDLSLQGREPQLVLRVSMGRVRLGANPSHNPTSSGWWKSHLISNRVSFETEKFRSLGYWSVYGWVFSIGYFLFSPEINRF